MEITRDLVAIGADQLFMGSSAMTMIEIGRDLRERNGGRMGRMIINMGEKIGDRRAAQADGDRMERMITSSMELEIHSTGLGNGAGMERMIISSMGGMIQMMTGSGIVGMATAGISGCHGRIDGEGAMEVNHLAAITREPHGKTTRETVRGAIGRRMRPRGRMIMHRDIEARRAVKVLEAGEALIAVIGMVILAILEMGDALIAVIGMVTAVVASEMVMMDGMVMDKAGEVTKVGRVLIYRGYRRSLWRLRLMRTTEEGRGLGLLGMIIKVEVTEIVIEFIILFKPVFRAEFG
jgi:hypothetical protein